MARAAFFLIALAGTFICGGCGLQDFDVPTDKTGQPTVSTIIERLQCEIIDMVRDDKEDFAPSFMRYFLLNRDYDVAVALQLEVNDSGGLSPSLSYINPLSKTTSFMFGGSATLNESHDSTFTENIQLSTRKIYSDWKYKTKRFVCPPEANTNLAGDLELWKIAAMAGLTDQSVGQPPSQTPPQCSAPPAPASPTPILKSSKSKPLPAPAPPPAPAAPASTTQFGDTITFTVTKNISGLGPTWSLVHFKGPGGLVNFSQVNTDKITLAFAPGPNAGCPISVVSNTPNLDAYRLLQQMLTSSINTQLQMLQQLP